LFGVIILFLKAHAKTCVGMPIGCRLFAWLNL